MTVNGGMNVMGALNVTTIGSTSGGIFFTPANSLVEFGSTSSSSTFTLTRPSQTSANGASLQLLGQDTTVGFTGGNMLSSLYLSPPFVYLILHRQSSRCWTRYWHRWWCDYWNNQCFFPSSWCFNKYACCQFRQCIGLK